MNCPRTFFMLLASTSHWRALDAAARRDVFDATLALVFNGYPDLRMTHYATGASRSCCSDVIVWETTDVAQYEEALVALAATPFFGAPLFEIVDVIAGVSDDDLDEFGGVAERAAQSAV